MQSSGAGNGTGAENQVGALELTSEVASRLKDGIELIPAIAQDHITGEVLMLAYMNHQSLALTLKTGQATYWSRSRNEIWVKGATSGNTQKVIAINLDCDGDAILLKVEQVGPACHTGEISCFSHPIQMNHDINNHDINNQSETP